MRKDPHARLKTVSAETKDILQELERDYKAPEQKEVKKEVSSTTSFPFLFTIIV